MMANLTDKIKSTWYKWIETLGQSAANMADNAKQKLNEINMEARRKEVVADLPSRLLQMWKDGVELPEELTDMLSELNGLEEELAAARAARLAKKMKPAITDGSDAEPVAQEAVYEEAECAAETVEEPAEEVSEEADVEEAFTETTDEAAPAETNEEETADTAAEAGEQTSDAPVAFDF